MKRVAVSACLLGEKCRYDGSDNCNALLIEALANDTIIPFCPEDFAFATPRPTMDLVETADGIRTISSLTGEDLSAPVIRYAHDFFDSHGDIDLFVGKDRSPSCGVKSARIYDAQKILLDSTGKGLMAQEAENRGIASWDAEEFVKAYKGHL